jgi:hypothetical protein
VVGTELGLRAVLGLADRDQLDLRLEGVLMKYRVTVTGEGTSGSFELTLGMGINAWATGALGVMFTAEDMQRRLDMLPTLHGHVVVTSAESDKLCGPKSWDIEIPDEAGPLWVEGRHSSGASRLTGPSSPDLVVVQL